MSRLTRPECVQIPRMLVEGQALGATARLADVSASTPIALLADAAPAPSATKKELFRGLTRKRVQYTEIWSFVAANDKATAENLVNCDDTTRFGAV